MARISDEDINHVRDATDIVSVVSEYVVLKQRGSDFWGCCPFHNEKTPSFHVIPQSQRWHCFGCGEGGDVFKFLVKKEGMTFPEAVRYLADRAHVTIHEEEGGLPSSYRAQLLACCDTASSFFHVQLMRSKSSDAAAARAYASSRGFSSDVCKDWDIGYAPGRGALANHLRTKGFDAKTLADTNLVLDADRSRSRDRFYERLMFPIRDLQGRTIAFGGRMVPALMPKGREVAKYINTSDTPLFHKRDNLFGIDRAKAAISSTGTAIVVEGYTDVISMHIAGFEQTVATLGTALTPQHIKLLRRFAKRIVYLFDGDAAGQKAADKASELIDRYIVPESGSQQVELLVVVLPGDKDPAEFLASEGADALRSHLDQAQPLMLFALRRRFSAYDLGRPEQRAQALDAALELLFPFKDSLLATDYINVVASDLAVDYDTVASALKRYRPRATSRKPDEESTNEGGFGSEDGYYPDPDEEMTSEALVDYTDELASWEREILALYLYNPSVRAYLGPRLIDIEWSGDTHASIADALVGLDIDASPASMTAEVEHMVPGSEDVWLVDTSPYLELDQPGLERLADRMLKGREIEQLERTIARYRAQLKFPEQMGSERYDKLFNYVVGLQNRVNDLRNKA